MGRLINILLQRSGESIPWGFRLEGGIDKKRPLTISQVIPGTIGNQHLKPGDILLRIGDRSATNLTVVEAEEIISQSQNRIELLIQKKAADHASPAVWSPASNLNSTGPNPFFSGVHSSPVSVTNPGVKNVPSTPRSSGPFWATRTTAAPSSSGPYWAVRTPSTSDSASTLWGVQTPNFMNSGVSRWSDQEANSTENGSSYWNTQRSNSEVPQWNTQSPREDVESRYSECANKQSDSQINFSFSSGPSPEISHLPNTIPDTNFSFLSTPVSDLPTPPTPICVSQCGMKSLENPTYRLQTSLPFQNTAATSTPSASPSDPLRNKETVMTQPQINIAASTSDYQQETTIVAPSPPPPPPPPPPLASGPTWRERQKTTNKDENSGYHPSQNCANTPQDGTDKPFSYLPGPLHGSLKKDKKPFTYIPGGIDLSQIKSPRMARRLIANQQDPGVGAKSESQREFEEQDDLNEINKHASQHLAPPSNIMQPVFPVIPRFEAATQEPAGFRVNANKADTHNFYNNNNNVSPCILKQPQKDVVVPSYNSPLNLYPSEKDLSAYKTQTEEVTRQLEGTNLGSDSMKSYQFPNLHQRSPPRKHEVYCPKTETEETSFFPQSRSFRLLQMLTDQDDEGPEDEVPSKREEDEMRFSGLRRNPFPSPTFQTIQKMTSPGGDCYETTPHATSMNENQDGDRTDDGPIEPRYQGCSIPSYAFRMLQEMTEAGSLPPSALHKPKKTTKLQLHIGEPQPPRPQQQNNIASPRQPYQQSFPRQPYQQSFPRQPYHQASPQQQYHQASPQQPFPRQQYHQAFPQQPSPQQQYNQSYYESQVPEEPKIYTGGKIPSRSFRMLQTMTGESPLPDGEDGTDF
ncbi:uncharacterized protein LOC143233599 isoform X2 [Tachypleus tridentatus]|uniref:uncharacterized protein LOC143233599 isoform X2 n=1 Tax=Tachypleus tridentatus TaxID=6853 RepID=UPI003FD18088